MIKLQIASPIRTLTLLSLALSLFLTATNARAVTPPPDGGYPNNNTAEGEDALFRLTLGVGNTAVGYRSLNYNTIGGGNTGIGQLSLFSNRVGNNNTALGSAALFSNLANGNTALGANALVSNTTGVQNTASGFASLESNTTGFFNTASGSSAMLQNQTGYNNVASGYAALQGNISGDNNTALGTNALGLNTTGDNNIGIGAGGGIKLTNGNNNIIIFDQGAPGDNNTIRIGQQGLQQTTYLAGVSGTTVAGGVGVVIDTKGRLGTVTSSARYKDGIKAMDKSSESLLSLKPVTFRYKKTLDPNGIPQYGLVAEQVAEVDPNLVARDATGKPYTVRYEAVNAMLLNEFLKEHRRVGQLEATVASLESAVKAQAAQLQKVNTRLDAQPQPRIIADTR